MSAKLTICESVISAIIHSPSFFDHYVVPAGRRSRHG
jgi:hypothetical protein